MAAERLISYADAIREATDQAMAADPGVFVLGMGVDDWRGIYGTTKGLVEKYGKERCFDTPLSEDAMTGVAIGAAMAGMRPIHVHIRMDFVMLCMNQLINIAAKARYMYGGAVKVPIVVRSVIGKSWGQGAQHSQGLHALFAHIPGLRVVVPATPYDVKGTLMQALKTDDPVMFIEHRMLHYQKGHVPAEPYTVPFGKARVLSQGSDVTIVAISWMNVEALRAKKSLEDVGVSAEIIDPVTVSPLDIESIAASVKKTKRLLVIDNGWLHAGLSGEIVAGVVERVEGVKVKRMGFAPTVCPTAKNLENLYYPNPSDLAQEAYRLVKGADKTWTPAQVEAPEHVQFKGPF